MISGPRVDIKIGGSTFNVPIFKDKDTTYYIAKLVQERIKEIEKRGGRIDTQAFAVEAAMSFAFAQLDAENELEENTQELMKALSNLSTEIGSITKDFDIHENKTPKT